MRLGRRYDSGAVPTQQPTRAPGTDAVDVAAFTPIAAWVRTRDGEPALRTMCAAAGIDSHLLAGSTRGDEQRVVAARMLSQRSKEGLEPGQRQGPPAGREEVGIDPGCGAHRTQRRLPVSCPHPGGDRAERREIHRVGAWPAGRLLSRDHAGTVSPGEPHCPTGRHPGAVRQLMSGILPHARAH